MLADKTINEFMADLASDLPAPGGGGVAALSGALAAGLLSMVCHLTIGKKGYESVEEQIKEILVKSDSLHKELTCLIDDDANVFNQVIASFKLPKETEEDKAARTAAIQDAYKRAAEIPFMIASTCLEVLELGQSMLGISNVNVISDIGVAAINGLAGVEAGVMNVNVNLPFIKDAAYVEEKKGALEQLLNTSRVIKENITAEVYKIIS